MDKDGVNGAIGYRRADGTHLLAFPAKAVILATGGVPAARSR